MPRGLVAFMLECEGCNHAYTALTKEDLWHRRYGHLGAQSLRQLSVEGYGMVQRSRVIVCMILVKVEK